MSRKKVPNTETFLGMGNRIRRVRGDLSQEEFGKILGGVGKSAVSRYEAGRVPDVGTLKMIADHGGVTVEWLLQGETVQNKLREDLYALTKPALTLPGLVEPYLFSAVDKTILAGIIEQVEEGLKRKKRALSSKRKAHLISLLYDEFQKTGQLPTKNIIQDFLDLV
jgi:transcriptional regulator with XRE-family HTH domain